MRYPVTRSKQLRRVAPPLSLTLTLGLNTTEDGYCCRSAAGGSRTGLERTGVNNRQRNLTQTSSLSRIQFYNRHHNRLPVSLKLLNPRQNPFVPPLPYLTLVFLMWPYPALTALPFYILPINPFPNPICNVGSSGF